MMPIQREPLWIHHTERANRSLYKSSLTYIYTWFSCCLPNVRHWSAAVSRAVLLAVPKIAGFHSYVIELLSPPDPTQAAKVQHFC